jgi:hypothetical protein
MFHERSDSVKLTYLNSSHQVIIILTNDDIMFALNDKNFRTEFVIKATVSPLIERHIMWFLFSILLLGLFLLWMFRFYC